MLRSLSTSAFALIVAAGPALAEVTPVQVWEDIVAYYSQFGYTVTEGARDEAGDSLSVSDVVLTVAGIEGTGGEVSIAIPKVALTTTGGGDVRTVFEGDLTGKVSTLGPDGEPTTVDFTVAAPGNEMVSSGEVGDITHALTYPTLTLTADLPTADEASAPVKLELLNTTGSYSTKTGEGMQVTYDTASESATVSLTAEKPANDEGGPAKMGLTMAMAGLKVTGTGSLPQERFNLNSQMSDALRAGLKMDGTISYDTVEAAVDYADQSEPGTDNSGVGKLTGEAGSIGFGLDQSGMTYEGKAGKTSVSFTTPDIPFPLDYASDSAAFGLTVPMLKSDTEQPFAFSYALGGLTLSDQIWGLFDPNAQLPRDPADLTIDLAGQAKVTRDMVDPEFQQRLMAAATPEKGDAPPTPEQQAELEALAAEAVPFTLTSLNVNKIALSAVGASVDVTGALTVPEGGDIQAPLGELNGTFTGINGLIDKLVAMGMIPQEQVTGARMMMMMFARPVEGQPDTMTTKLEFKEGGEILANGQKVK